MRWSARTPLYSSDMPTDALEQRLGVQGAPLAVDDGLDPVEHHDMGVQLRVPGPGVPVLERRRYDAADFLGHDAAASHTGGEYLRLPVRDDLLQGAPVGGVDPLPRVGSSANAHATDTDLGRRTSGRIRPLPCGALRTRPRWSMSWSAAARRAPERLPRDRVLQHPEHPPQLLLA